MEPSLHQIVLTAAVCFFASFIQGTSGFGSALVAMPLLITFLPPRVATPLCILMGLIITADLTARLRTHVEWKEVAILTVGCVPGIAAGIFLLGSSNDVLMRKLLGAVLFLYSTYALFIRIPGVYPRRAWGVVAGFMAGTLGASLSTGGPPAIIYCTLKAWDRDRMKATLSAFFLLTGIITVPAHYAAGFTTVTVTRLFAWAAAPILAGTWLGSALYNRMSREAYTKILLFLLLGAGLLLVFS